MRALDLPVSRKIRLGKHRDLEIIAEGFNLLNRANLQLPNHTFGAGNTPLRGFGIATAAVDPRQIRFGLRRNF